jgi:hypothetical protein
MESVEMTDEQIRKWATDIWGVSNWTQIQIGRLKRFAEMARADEREACAKVCAEDNVQAMDFTGGTFVGGYFSKKIIDRGQA